MIRLAITVRAESAVAAVLDRLWNVADEAAVAVRRQDGDAPSWYAFAAGDVRRACQQALAGPDGRLTPLGIALDLHETDSVPIIDADTAGAGDLRTGPGVLVAGAAAVGVLEPLSRPRSLLGERLSLDVGARDRIVFGKYSGSEVKVDREEFLILREEDVLAQVEAAGVEEPGAATTPPSPSPPKPSPRARRTRGARVTRGKAATRGANVADPPRSAYALLDAPALVVAGDEVDVTVGLAPEPSPEVAAQPLVRPATSTGPYDLTIQVVAAGFALRAGESWRRTVRVTAEEAYPRVGLHVTALPQDAAVVPHLIQAIYSVDGQTMGVAARAVAVVRTADLAALVAPPDPDRGVDMAVPTAADAPDLTVRILTDPARPGVLRWALESRFADVDLPDEPPESNIGTEPQGFARRLMQRVNLQEGKPGLYTFIVGHGRSIAQHVPAALWRALRDVAGRVGGAPTVLILSQEAYVPWELAVMEAPLVEATAPPFLAAQARVGRWVLASPRPKTPPPAELTVDQIAVIWGVYDRPQWRRLTQAEDEARSLQTTYGATNVDATAAQVLACLGGVPPATLLHFSLHGTYDPNGVQEGLVLVDGQFLDPMHVKGSDLRAAPFVFLNACQVGQGQQILGDYAGLAEAFLYAGASAVVAPLWSVKDDVARTIALEFYQQVLGGDARPADVLREARRRFTETATPSGTYLAYQFFGHPALRLRR
jgi:hypothetical protein